MPTVKVAASTTSPHLKAKSGKKSYAAVERYLTQLDKFLEQGEFTYSSESRLEPLAQLTIVSYKSFIRKFLEALVQGLIAGHGDGRYRAVCLFICLFIYLFCSCHVTCKIEVLATESDDETYKMLVLLCGKLEHISHFVRAREADNFVGRSQVNLMCALLWHLAFLYHLTHPRAPTKSWEAEDLLLRQILLPPTRDAATELRDNLDESRRYLRQQIGRLKDRAEQQVKARNSREALEERGTWISIEWMNVMARALDEEGWARMHRLEAALRFTSLHELIGMHGHHRAQFDWLRDWLVFSLFVDLPPMRPQNGELQIMDHPEPAGSRQTNGILFYKSRASLQIIHFKNAAFMGEHVVDLPDRLQAKLLAYLRVVRPVYAYEARRGTTYEQEAGDEESSSEDEAASGEEENSAAAAACEEDHSTPSTSRPPPLRPSTRHREELLEEVHEWRAQSPWLFLKPGNQPAKRIGALWIDFVQHNTGQKTNLRVWRKVAETASAQNNSLDQQQMLSGALLHQHKTGQEYYVTHNPREKSQQLHQVWHGLMVSG